MGRISSVAVVVLVQVAELMEEVRLSLLDGPWCGKENQTVNQDFLSLPGGRCCVSHVSLVTPSMVTAGWKPCAADT